MLKNFMLYIVYQIRYLFYKFLNSTFNLIVYISNIILNIKLNLEKDEYFPQINNNLNIKI